MKWYLVIIYISLVTNDVENLFMCLLLIYSLLKNIQAFPGSLAVKNLPANAGDSGDTGSTPGSGRFPEERNGNSLQYSCLENPINRGAWRATVHGVAKSWTQLSK